MGEGVKGAMVGREIRGRCGRHFFAFSFFSSFQLSPRYMVKNHQVSLLSY